MGNSPSKNEPLPSSSSTITPPAAADDDDVPLSRRNPLNIHSSTQKKSARREVDLDLEIAASMARLLVPAPSAARPCVPSDYGSSLDSETSASPLFSSEKDEDSVFALGSVSNSPKQRDLEESVGCLDPIFETLESTPEPETPFGLPYDHKLNNVASQVSVSSSETSASTSAPASYTKKYAVPSPTPGCDIDGIIDRLVQVGLRRHRKTSHKNRDRLPLTNDDIKYILTKSRSVFMSQPTLLRLSPPVKVVGDIHGQFSDLIRIFNSCGYPPYTNYLFLGDYVDRGYRSLETILLLLCYKIKYPENFFMLRGNHECANITKVYGFYDECKRRLPSITGNHKMWKSFIDVFNTLPIAATINDKIFCIHGGLSPELQDLSQIENIKRPTDVPDKGLLADLLWSDPDPSVRTFSLSHWPRNDRGVSYCFGKKHVDYFCTLFNFDLIVRGHMVVEDGYEFFNKRKLVTVFAAPNYCGEFNNCGALMSVDKALCCSFEIIKPS